MEFVLFVTILGAVFTVVLKLADIVYTRTRKDDPEPHKDNPDDVYHRDAL